MEYRAGASLRIGLSPLLWVLAGPPGVPPGVPPGAAPRRLPPSRLPPGVPPRSTTSREAPRRLLPREPRAVMLHWLMRCVLRWLHVMVWTLMMTPSWLEHLQSRCKWAKKWMVEWWTTMTTPLRQVLLLLLTRVVLVLVLVVEIPVCCRGRLGMPGWACLAGHAWLGMPGWACPADWAGPVGRPVGWRYESGEQGRGFC